MGLMSYKDGQWKSMTAQWYDNGWKEVQVCRYNGIDWEPMIDSGTSLVENNYFLINGENALNIYGTTIKEFNLVEGTTDSITTIDTKHKLKYTYQDDILNIYPGEKTVCYNADSSRMFYQANNLKTIDSNIDTTFLSNMAGICSNAEQLISNGFSGPNVTNMVGAFTGCKNITYVEIGPNVTNLALAFSGCAKVSHDINVGPATTNISGAFFAINSKNINLQDQVTDASLAFKNCKSLVTVNVGQSPLFTMANAFNGCSNLTTVYTGTQTTNIHSMCYNARNIREVYIQTQASAEDMVITGCFARLSNSIRHNIHIPMGLNECFNKSSCYNISSSFSISWTQDTDCYYNSAMNIYIYQDIVF